MSLDIDQQIKELNEEIKCHLKPSNIQGIGKMLPNYKIIYPWIKD